MFSTPVQVTISPDRTNARTIVELVAGDRPGLLFQIAKIFDQQAVALQNAKILTVGERAEDVFFVTNAARQPLDDASSERLGRALREGLADAQSN
jgi:[protein-PII] uridylyltransferase